MFDDNFSFDAPRSPSIGSTTTATRESSRSVSPCTNTTPFAPPRFSVTDLAAQFADQRIHKKAAICYDACDAYANNDDDDADWSIPSVDDDDEEELHQLSRARTFPVRAHSPSRRTQRQLNSRLLCSSSHHRDIATLVARMVNAKDQCSVTPPGSSTPTREDPEDEGYNSGSDVEMALPSSRRSSTVTLRSRVDSRRGSDLRSGGARVSKSIGFRRDRNRRVRSSEQQQA